MLCTGAMSLTVAKDTPEQWMQKKQGWGIVSFADLSIFLVNVTILVLAIGIVNTQSAYATGIVGTLILCFIDRNERNK